MGKIKYLQIVDSRKNQPMFRLKCMQSVKDKVGDNEYKVIEIPFFEDRLKMVRIADELRLKMAAAEGDLCYVDTDVFMAKPIHEFETMTADRPYFAQYEYNSTMHAPDIFYFYVNGRTDYFQNNLPSPACLQEHGYSVKRDILESLDGYEVIPPMSYFHAYETMNRVIENKRFSDFKKEFDRQSTAYEALEKGIEQLNIVLKMGKNGV